MFWWQDLKRQLGWLVGSNLRSVVVSVPVAEAATAARRVRRVATWMAARGYDVAETHDGDQEVTLTFRSQTRMQTTHPA